MLPTEIADSGGDVGTNEHELEAGDLPLLVIPIGSNFERSIARVQALHDRREPDKRHRGRQMRSVLRFEVSPRLRDAAS